MVGDVMYVGNRGYNRMGAFQGGGRQLLNAPDIGTAYLPAKQDPTLGTSTIPGKTAYANNLLRPYPGIGPIEENATRFWDRYHSMQFSVNRRFRGGFSFGANYTWGITLIGNTGLNERYVHAADGKISLRSDQAAYEKLMEKLDVRPHLIKANAVWNSPDIQSAGSIVRHLVKDWQISGIWTGSSGAAYDLAYTYTSDGGNVNITGSPDWGGRVKLGSNLGSGCSSNQFGQFTGAAVTGPGYNSVSMESGRNYMRYCPNKTVDMSLVRRISFGKIFNESRRLEMRLDVFNALNTVVINGVSTTATFNNPTAMALQNNQYLSDGTLNPARMQPKSAGFGAATGAQNMRNLQIQFRFSF